MKIIIDVLNITTEDLIDISSGSEFIEVNELKFIKRNVWNIFDNRCEDSVAGQNDFCRMNNDLVFVFICVNIEITDLIDGANLDFFSNMWCIKCTNRCMNCLMLKKITYMVIEFNINYRDIS